MADITNLTNFLTDVSTAIKAKIGDNTNIPAAQFDNKIMSIETKGTYQNKFVNITNNGTFNISPDSGYDAMEIVNIGVNVSDPEYNTNLQLSNQILGIN